MKKKTEKKIGELIHQSVPSKIRLKSLQLAPGGERIGNSTTSKISCPK